MPTMIKILPENSNEMIIAEGLKNFEYLEVFQDHRYDFKADACCHIVS
jgi:hypothetical protein